MAKGRTLTSTATLYFNGTQAKNELAILEKAVIQLKKEIAEMAAKEGTPDFNDEKLKELNKELETTNRLVAKGHKEVNGYEEVLESLTDARMSELQLAQRLAKRVVNNFNPKNMEFGDPTERLQATVSGYDEIQARIKALKAGFTDAMQASENTAGMTVAQLERLKGVLIEEQKLVATDKAAWEDYGNTINKITADIERLKGLDADTQKEAALKIVSKPSDYSVDEIRQAVKTLEELQEKQKLSKTEWSSMSESIQKAKEHIQEFVDSAKMDAMSKQFERLEYLSASALAEQKKYWEGVYNSAEKASDEYKKAEDNLTRMKELSEKRVKDEARIVISEVKTGNYSGTVAQTQENIKLLREYQQLLETTDAPGLEEVSKVLTKLTTKEKNALAGLMDYKEALNAAESMSKGQWTGTVQEIDKVRESIKAYQESLVNTGKNKEDVEKVSNALRYVEVYANQSAAGIKDLDKFLETLDDASLEQLQAAAKALEAKIAGARRETEEYVKATAKLRQVNKQIKQINDDMEYQGNIIVKTAKRLASYVLVYTGFNEIVGYTRQWAQENLELSDSLAGIQKTTGMTRKEVANLSNELDKIDTRQTQKELADLAYTAGQLGYSIQEEVLGFVKAGNQVIVALGEELGGAESVKTLTKINELMGETANLGVEKSLLATGSAINELSQASTASAGPIVDVINRLGGIGAQANLSTADLAALGATTDALAQSAEVSGTALNKFIQVIASQPTKVAKAVGLNEKTLQDMIKQGKTMEAIILVLEKMNKMGGLGALSPIMGDLGSEGARMTQVFAALAGNVDFLKRQVELSNQAFKDATSITREYNVMNENAAALMQRLGNNIREYFVNSGFVEWIRQVLLQIMRLPEWVEKNVLSFTEYSASVGLFMTALAGPKVLKAIADLRTALSALFGLISKHPWVLALTSLGYLIGAFVRVRNATTEAEEAQKRLNESYKDFTGEYLKEYRALNDMFGALQKAKKGTEDRKKVIDAINKNYGKYLDNMLSEKSSALELKKAYDLINASLKEQIAIKIRNQALDDAQTRAVKTQAEALDSLRKQFGDEKYNVSDKTIELVLDQVVKKTEEKMRAGTENYMAVNEIIREEFGRIVGGGNYATEEMSAALREYVNSVYNTFNETAAIKKKFDPLITGLLDEFKTEKEEPDVVVTEASDKKKDKEKQREARQAYQASVSALKAYFNERETLIRKSNLTEEDMNRQLLATQIEYEQDSQELRKKFIGDENTFDPSKYKGVLSGYEYFTKKDLDEQAKQYQTFGDYMTDGARNMITQSGLKIEELMDKQKENIKKTLLEGDMFAGFEDKFAKMLDELGVLTSEAEDKLFADANAANRMNGIDQVIGLTPEMRKQRIAALVSFADESYKVTADGLKTLMMENEAYAEWVEDLDEDQMNAILQKLRWYYDERLSLIKKYQDQINKEFDMSYEQSGQKFKDEQRKQEVDEAGAELEMMEQLGITPNYKDKMQQKTDEYLAEIAKQKARMDDALDRMDVAALEMEEAEQNYGTDSDEYRSAEARYFAAQTIMTQIQIDNNKLRAENEREQTQIMLDEWQKRAEKMGEFSSMFGDFLGEQIMLEKQANDARARGDLDTAKKIEQQQKQNKQNLIKNLLNFIVDEAALWAKELGLKMMFNAMSLADDKKKAVEEVSLEGKKSILSIFLSALTGQASEAKKGLPGLITGAIVFAATMALQAMAKSAISNMFPEASTGSTNTRKMSTGMLTYEKGNYPVLGNDGKVYDAKYEGAGMKTGVYGGGAHFGIFSEKQPEMIVDGKTTQKIILNYPYIYDAITTIAKNGRLKNALPTFASGDYPAGIKQLTAAVPVADTAQSEAAIAREERNNAVIEQATMVIKELSRVLTSGQISANVDPYANSKATKRAERFMKRRGIG